jgi:hypothetical protein
MKVRLKALALDIWRVARFIRQNARVVKWKRGGPQGIRAKRGLKWLPGRKNEISRWNLPCLLRKVRSKLEIVSLWSPRQPRPGFSPLFLEGTFCTFILLDDSRIIQPYNTEVIKWLLLAKTLKSQKKAFTVRLGITKWHTGRNSNLTVNYHSNS